MSGYFFIFAGLIALAFLIYSLIHLIKLNISITHPRVIVELVLFLYCLRGLTTARGLTMTKNFDN